MNYIFVFCLSALFFLVCASADFGSSKEWIEILRKEFEKELNINESKLKEHIANVTKSEVSVSEQEVEFRQRHQNQIRIIDDYLTCTRKWSTGKMQRSCGFDATVTYPEGLVEVGRQVERLQTDISEYNHRLKTVKLKWKRNFAITDDAE
ncbi:unnamed protein product [Schistosoma turkestanicum]|nr:unnamed protein product [Schistosoma turkestanicum]